MKKTLLFIIILVLTISTFAFKEGTISRDALKSNWYGYDTEGAKVVKEYLQNNRNSKGDKLTIDETTNPVEGWTVRFSSLFDSVLYLKLTDAEKAASYPTAFDLRSLDAITPVRDQNWHGLCWSFGGIATLESNIIMQWDNFAKKYPKLIDSGLVSKTDLNLSEQFMAYHNMKWIGSPVSLAAEEHLDRGGWGFAVHYNFLRYGAPLESDFPFIGNSLPQGGYGNDGTGQRNIIFNPQNNNWEEHLIKPDKTIYIADPWDQAAGGYYENYDEYIKTIKKALMTYGALEVSYDVPDDFGATIKDFGGIYTPTATTISVDGGHAVTLVGWNDAMPMNANLIAYLNAHPEIRAFAGIPADATTIPVWIIKNSWNTDWGVDGYFYMPWVSPSVWENDVASDGKVDSEWWKVDRDWMIQSVFETPSFLKADFSGNGVIDDADFDLLKVIMDKIVDGTTLTTEEIAKYDISLVRDGIVNYDDFFEFIKLWNYANGN